MYRIAKLNKIANVVNDYFPAEQFDLAETDDPHGIIVRSADMHGYDKGNNLLAVARAGAGVNNIPLDDMAQKGVVRCDLVSSGRRLPKDDVRKIVQDIERIRKETGIAVCCSFGLLDQELTKTIEDLKIEEFRIGSLGNLGTELYEEWDSQIGTLE